LTGGWHAVPTALAHVSIAAAKNSRALETVSSHLTCTLSPL
jgi:hypothetical protein